MINTKRIKKYSALTFFMFFMNMAYADLIDLDVTYRDFDASHPDFQSFCCNLAPGMVEGQLGPDGKPVYAATRPVIDYMSSQASFSQWYNDSDESVTSQGIITLDNGMVAPGGSYNFTDNTFFPLTPANSPFNYYFTMELSTDFTYQAGQEFTFTGDDDVWVFIDDQLVIDLGGVHGAASQTVLLDSLGLTEGNNYAFDLFFAERHTTQSNFSMVTNLPLNTTSVSEPISIALFAMGILGLGMRRRKV